MNILHYVHITEGKGLDWASRLSAAGWVGLRLACSRLSTSGEDRRKTQASDVWEQEPNGLLLGPATSGSRETEGESGTACKHCFKNLIPLTWKKKPKRRYIKYKNRV